MHPAIEIGLIVLVVIALYLAYYNYGPSKHHKKDKSDSSNNSGSTTFSNYSQNAGNGESCHNFNAENFYADAGPTTSTNPPSHGPGIMPAGMSSLPVSRINEVTAGSSLAPPAHAVKPVTSYNTNVLAPPTPSNPLPPQSSVMTEPEYAPLGCFPKDQLTSSDLLPKQGGWEASNPTIPLSSLSGSNFLTSGTMYGINTTGSSLRNANLQLRSDPCIPRLNVGPWSQSTIEPDNNRKYLEIGNA